MVRHRSTVHSDRGRSNSSCIIQRDRQVLWQWVQRLEYRRHLAYCPIAVPPRSVARVHHNACVYETRIQPYLWNRHDTSSRNFSRTSRIVVVAQIQESTQRRVAVVQLLPNEIYIIKSKSDITDIKLIWDLDISMRNGTNRACCVHSSLVASTRPHSSQAQLTGSSFLMLRMLSWRDGGCCCCCACCCCCCCCCCWSDLGAVGADRGETPGLCLSLFMWMTNLSRRANALPTTFIIFFYSSICFT